MSKKVALRRKTSRTAAQVMPLPGFELDDFDADPHAYAVHLPSPEEIRTRGWTKETLASWGIPFPPPKPLIERINRQNAPAELLDFFAKLEALSAQGNHRGKSANN